MPPASDTTDLFRTVTVTSADIYEALRASVQWEDVGNGRQGAVLLKGDVTSGFPIVRTTTRYRNAAQLFRPIHDQLAQQIQTRLALSVAFNNALIESYTNAYTTMGSHSDQALDLAEDSYIALFSCYKYPAQAKQQRKLLVSAKDDSAPPTTILLPHGSIVAFSVGTNRLFKHKIVMAGSPTSPDNEWLGITFRTSKTAIHYRDEAAYFADGVGLTLASADEQRTFYQLRSRENHETTFVYPGIAYTISESDLMPPFL